MTKTKRRWIIIAIIIIVIILGIRIWLGQNYHVVMDSPAMSYVLGGCSEEGEEVGSHYYGCDDWHSCPARCCWGLKAMTPSLFDAQCGMNIMIPGMSPLSVCSECGNGVCETQNAENKCTCPEDCTEGQESTFKPCTTHFQDIIDDSDYCCPGLKAIKIARYDDNCSIIPGTASAVMKCLLCGDGRCDQTENKCSCPEDCKE